MGCANSRQDADIQKLCKDCDYQMEYNLNLLNLLEYISVEDSKISLALSLMLIKRRTDEYYTIIIAYRRFWLSELKSSLNELSYTSVRDLCIKEHSKEKFQLKQCKDTLRLCIDKLRYNWNANFETLDDMLNSIKENTAVIQDHAALYESFYKASKEEIQTEIEENCMPLTKADKEMLDLIKLFTVNLYKNPETRVYYTPKISIRNKQNQKKNSRVNSLKLRDAKTEESSFQVLKSDRNGEKTNYNSSRQFKSTDLRIRTEEDYEKKSKDDDSLIMENKKPISFLSGGSSFDESQKEDFGARISISQK
jgi:hypothetical protein